MKIQVQLLVESDNGHEEIVDEVQTWQRDEPLHPSNLGLTLAESKQVLLKIQQILVEKQIEQYQQQQSLCSACGKKLRHKGAHSLVYRTLFGNLNLKSPRLFHCPCQKQPQKTFSPLAALLVERTAPERLYLESKFASLMSYGLTVKL
ncbi:MAG: ISKra4 family transposase, partial [Cyanobacteriota bacterium]|nr:ISKra4 family transposase [Cyanobacteriota bacterium]